MIKSNCDNCGDALNLTKDKCESCGTYWREPTPVIDNDHLLKHTGLVIEDPTRLVHIPYIAGSRDQFSKGCKQYIPNF